MRQEHRIADARVDRLRRREDRLDAFEGEAHIPVLLPGEAHVWIASIGSAGLASDLAESLSPDERERAGRFYFDEHRRAYVFAHAVLRDILSRYTHRPAGALRFDTDAFGKPFLVDAGSRIPPCFNLSHSRGLALIAVTCNHQVGVDVEEVRPLQEFADIVRTHFSPEECASVLRATPEERDRAFFRCWTRKESYIKALGQGLSIPLNSFDTSIVAGNSARIMPRAPEAPGVANWLVADLEVPSGYSGALTIEGEIDCVVYFVWSSAWIEPTKQCT